MRLDPSNYNKNHFSRASPAKGKPKPRKWTAAQHKKYSTTCALKKRQRKGGSEGSKRAAKPQKIDALIYLQHAQRSIVKRRCTVDQLTDAEFYALLALRALLGEE